MRAYLIEPQKIFVPFLCSALRSAGIEVIATAEDVDGHDIVGHAPDVVFVDLDFSERGGPWTLCRIREAAKRLTIVAFSNNDDPTFEATCYISGANAFVAKSASVETLTKVVRSLGSQSAVSPVSGVGSPRRLDPKASSGE